MTVSVPLFAYGTLQQSNVQMATFGRLLEGDPDALSGYVLTPLVISDAYVMKTSGLSVHNAARCTGNVADVVSGMVYMITEAELGRADEYEVEEMTRVEVDLASGRRSFVYVRTDVSE